MTDDKGPVVASLYALKALRDEGMKPKMNIRIVLGLDEETGHISAEHYTEHCGHPALGFTPDADFPLVNGEMGILVLSLQESFLQNREKMTSDLQNLRAARPTMQYLHMPRQSLRETGINTIS